MTVLELHYDPIPPGWEHVDELPGWLRPSRIHGRYWHQPRSAALKPDGGLSVHTWCGQVRRCKPHDLTGTAPDDYQCGTCVGRRVGYERTAGMIFTPKDRWAPPTYCPGGDDGHGHCVGCGRPVRYYGLFGGPTRHKADEQLLRRWRPCPYHGWREMRPRDGLLVCASWRCGYTGIGDTND